MIDHRVVGVVLLVVAALLVANPLYLYQHPDELNHVTVLGSSYGGPVAANYTFGELSPRGQDLVRSAVTADDGRVSFHGDGRRPAEFEFGPDEDQAVSVVGEVYRVEYEGTTYLIRTAEAPPTNTEGRRSRGLIAFGVVLGLIGLLYVRDEHAPNLGVGLAGTGVVLLALNLLFRYARGAVGPLGLFGSEIFIGISLLVAIASAGYLFFATMRRQHYPGAL